MSRPTYKELDKKLSEARQSIDKGRVNMINPLAMASDADELGYRIEDQFVEVLVSVLDTATPDHYAGQRPPSLSYQNIIMAQALYAFKTQSNTLNCDVYLKFTIFDNELWVVSFHKNRNLKTGRMR